MLRRPIRSTSLKAVGYDPATQTLEIEYRHGGLVRYTGVPAELHQALFVEQVVERGGFGREQLRGK